MSEGTVLPVARAFANAIYNAIGVRIKDLPTTPDKILTALPPKQSMDFRTGPWRISRGDAYSDDFAN